MQFVTNQKVLFAQAQLDCLKDTLASACSPRDAILAQGYADACIYHLMAAWHALIQETLSSYDIKSPIPSKEMGVSMLSFYSNVCEKQDVVIPELNHIIKLSERPESFLMQLLKMFEQSFETAPQHLPAPPEKENHITLPGRSEIDSLQVIKQQLDQIVIEMKDLVQFCRQAMQEY